MSRNTKLIRAGPTWFRLEDELKRQGVQFTRPELTEGLAQFVLHENMVPLLARRSRERKRGLF